MGNTLICKQNIHWNLPQKYGQVARDHHEEDFNLRVQGSKLKHDALLD